MDSFVLFGFKVRKLVGVSSGHSVKLKGKEGKILLT